MMWIMLIIMIIGYGAVGIGYYVEFQKDKKKVEELGKERAELVEELYKLCGIAELQQEMIRDLQKRILIIEQKIEELNDKWM